MHIIKETKEHDLLIEIKCLTCNRVYTVTVPKDGYFAWRNGEKIQDAIPEVSVDDRELFISNTCPGCFDSMFPPDS